MLLTYQVFLLLLMPSKTDTTFTLRLRRRRILFVPTRGRGGFEVSMQVRITNDEEGWELISDLEAFNSPGAIKALLRQQM